MCKEGEQVLNTSLEMDSNIAMPKTTSINSESVITSDNSSIEQTTTEAGSERSSSNDPQIMIPSTSQDVRSEQSRRPQLEPVRRSTRDPNVAFLDKKEVQVLLSKIRSNHPDTVVLKIKHHLDADVNEVVLSAIVDALRINTVCEGLYVQNLSRAMTHEVLQKLVEVFKMPRCKIWCLNIGENYEISTSMWEWFCEELPNTKITHLYASEHVIPIDLKNKMRSYIRENRQKHTMHCSIKNLSVIERCTHMWWNPINGVKELKPPPPVQPIAIPVPEKPKPITLTPHHTAYWQEGVGKGGEKPWKFKCICGEVCSSYENYRYHPIGRMFECTVCTLWGHVDCVLGSHVTDDDLEEMTDVMCAPCHTRVLRYRRLSPDREIQGIMDELRLEYAPKELPTIYKNAGKGAKTTPTKGKNATSSSSSSASKKPSSSSGAKKSRTVKDTAVSDDDEVASEEEGDWKFKCKCGEVCSSYENPLYHPVGLRFQCTKCQLWSHVACVLGERVTSSDVKKLKDVLCYSCQSKSCRSSRGGNELIDAEKVLQEVFPGDQLLRGRKKARPSIEVSAAPQSTTATTTMTTTSNDANLSTAEGNASSSTSITTTYPYPEETVAITALDTANSYWDEL